MKINCLRVNWCNETIDFVCAGLHYGKQRGFPGNKEYEGLGRLSIWYVLKKRRYVYTSLGVDLSPFELIMSLIHYVITRLFDVEKVHIRSFPTYFAWGISPVYSYYVVRPY